MRSAWELQGRAASAAERLPHPGSRWFGVRIGALFFCVVWLVAAGVFNLGLMMRPFGVRLFARPCGQAISNG